MGEPLPASLLPNYTSKDSAPSAEGERGTEFPGRGPTVAGHMADQARGKKRTEVSQPHQLLHLTGTKGFRQQPTASGLPLPPADPEHLPKGIKWEETSGTHPCLSHLPNSRHESNLKQQGHHSYSVPNPGSWRHSPRPPHTHWFTTHSMPVLGRKRLREKLKLRGRSLESSASGHFPLQEENLSKAVFIS